MDWIRRNAEERGVIYFADDDNSYDARIFEEIRTTRRVSVFPVGLILKYGVSSTIVRAGVVTGFFDAFQAGRHFAMDMAGFAVSVRLFKSRPEATFPAKVRKLLLVIEYPFLMISRFRGKILTREKYFEISFYKQLIVM